MDEVFLYRDWDRYFVLCGSEYFGGFRSPVLCLHEYMKEAYGDHKIRMRSIPIASGMGHREKVQINGLINEWLALKDFDEFLEEL